MIPKTLKEIQAFTAKAFCNHLVSLKYKDIISEDTFDKLFKFIDINNVSDHTLVNDNRFRERVDWNNLKKLKLVRILARDIALLEKVDVSNYNFELMDVYPILLIYPELIDYFEIDFETLTWFEVIKLIECNNDFVDKVDISKYKPNKSQALEIVSKFSRNEKVMSQINLENLSDHFTIRKLLKKTGDKYINQINLKNLKTKDWIDILETQPGLLEYCNLLLFETNDCYPLIDLTAMFPELNYLLEDNKDKISGLGWEKLIIRDYEKYENICSWERLTKKNWETIIQKKPDLRVVMKKYY